MKAWNSHRVQSAQHPYGGYIGIRGQLCESCPRRKKINMKQKYPLLFYGFNYGTR